MNFRRAVLLLVFLGLLTPVATSGTPTPPSRQPTCRTFLDLSETERSELLEEFESYRNIDGTVMEPREVRSWLKKVCSQPVYADSMVYDVLLSIQAALIQRRAEEVQPQGLISQMADSAFPLLGLPISLLLLATALFMGWDLLVAYNQTATTPADYLRRRHSPVLQWIFMQSRLGEAERPPKKLLWRRLLLAALMGLGVFVGWLGSVIP